MLKWQRWCFLFLFLVLGESFLFAQPAKKEEIPPWMENVDKTGRSTYLVPKGAKVQKVGPTYVIETPNEYMARRFYELELRLDKMEQREEELDKKLESLQGQLADLNAALEDLKKEMASQSAAGRAIPIEAFEEKEP